MEILLFACAQRETGNWETEPLSSVTRNMERRSAGDLALRQSLALTGVFAQSDFVPFGRSKMLKRTESRYRRAETAAVICRVAPEAKLSSRTLDLQSAHLASHFARELLRAM